MPKTIAEIKELVRSGKAVVLTSQEVCDLVESGRRSELKGVDVVTAATRAVMSGTYAILSFSVSRPNSFVRAKEVWINGIPAHVGPCPNEKLGIVDIVLFGTAHSREDPRYGAGHLFRDLVEGKAASVEVETDGGERFGIKVRLEEMPHARLFGSRHCFKNYAAFVNAGEHTLLTIFHATGLLPRCSSATFSGCGQINPIKNDPLLEAIGIGTRILMNGAQGFVIGAGTRSTPSRPNLAGFADMHVMKGEYMGGLLTSLGPECICSWAVPIPVISPSIMEAIACLDREISLPIMDAVTRQPLGETNYGEVWDSADLEVEFYPENCLDCAECKVRTACPAGALDFRQGISWDARRCFHCGLCATLCLGGAFKSNLGKITLGGRKIPVVMRQSDRAGALRLAEELKRSILDGSFEITPKVEKIS